MQKKTEHKGGEKKNHIFDVCHKLTPEKCNSDVWERPELDVTKKKDKKWPEK